MGGSSTQLPAPGAAAPTPHGVCGVYQVRARFGEDEDDGGVVDTQWVLLSDLLEHVSLQTALDRELDKYARGLQANARRAREALRRT